MYDVQNPTRTDLLRSLSHVWADITNGQRRAAELNTPWVARRRSGQP